ncbi:MAG: hypothetical protein ACSHWU_12845, partial [Marinicella sp.]
LFSFQTQAATLYVDSNGLCNGLNDCFTTIQAATNQAIPDDEIRIFPGVYTESVDLSLMGSSLPVPQKGNISFFTVNTSNKVDPNTASVTPTTNPGIHHSNQEFNGNVQIDGLNFTAAADDGIDFGANNGHIVIRNVVSSNNQDDGIDLELINTGFSMLTENSLASDNGSHGLNLDAPDNTEITLNRIVANNNSSEGIDIDIDIDFDGNRCLTFVNQ